jgi:hypothetical protein
MEKDSETLKVRHFVIYFYLYLIVTKAIDVHPFKNSRKAKVEALG